LSLIEKDKPFWILYVNTYFATDKSTLKLPLMIILASFVL